MHFKNALFKIVSKIQTLVFCAFFNKIAFGKSDEEKFEEKQAAPCILPLSGSQGDKVQQTPFTSSCVIYYFVRL